MTKHGLAVSIAALSLLAGGVARAQYSVPSQAAAAKGVASGTGSARSKVKEELLGPSGWEIGASLNFFTARTSLGGEDIRFTDVVMLRLHGLISLGGKVELFLGSDILPKQPSYTDELAWQGVLAGARFALGKSFAAWVRGDFGPQIERAGWWVGGDAAVQYKMAIEEVLFFESALGFAHTQLFLDANTDDPFFQDEVFTQVGIAIRDPKKGQFGTWLMFDYYYPILGRPSTSDPDPASMLSLDPQPRVNFHLGGLVGVSEKVDLFIEWSILDRGDLEDPLTTLPILNTGFDQKQLLFGFMRRFGFERRPDRSSPGRSMPSDPEG